MESRVIIIASASEQRPTILGFQGCLLYTGLTVFSNREFLSICHKYVRLNVQQIFYALKTQLEITNTKSILVSFVNE